MNKIISFAMLISMVVTGLSSYYLFRRFEYNASAVLTIASYLSIVAGIYALTVRNKKSAHQRIRIAGEK